MSAFKPDSRDIVRNLDTDVGKRIRARRELLGLSQQHLSIMLEGMYGVVWHQTTVGKVEAGERPVRLAEAVAIAATLDVALTELVYGDADEQQRRAVIERSFHELSEIRRYTDHRMKTLRTELFGEDDDGVDPGEA